MEIPDFIKVLLLFTVRVLSTSSVLLASSVFVTTPTSAPASAPVISQSHVSFSIEQDRWVDWVGTGAQNKNQFFFNLLNNLKMITGEPARVRIGADSEDHTDFNSAIQFSDATFPPPSQVVPYPEAAEIVVGDNFYRLASLLPEGTQVIWGVNLGMNNLSAAYLEATALAQAFASPEMQQAGVTLEAIEIGNEPDLYSHHGLRRYWNPAEYVKEWTAFATNVSLAVRNVLGFTVPFLGISCAESTHTDTGFSPQSMFKQGILNSDAGSLLTTVSQHHYSGSFCSGSNGILQNLMTKSSIRGNLTVFSTDIAAVHAQGLDYILGETNSYSCHGAPGVSNTAGAALWALDYALFASQIGISRVYFHHGVGNKYNFIQPITINRSILDAHPLPRPLPPHIQPAYYAAVIAAEAIGDSGATQVVELDVGSDHVSGYAFYDGGALARAVLINLRAYTGSAGERGSVNVALRFDDRDITTKMTVKRLNIPLANATAGITWGGQTYETADGNVSGDLSVTTVPAGLGVDVFDTEALLLTFL